jgi:hypothetical protein
MTASPTDDDPDKTARQTVDTVCYWRVIPKPRAEGLIMSDPVGEAHCHGEGSPRGNRALVISFFGPIRLRSSTGISIQINGAMQFTNVHVIGELLSRVLKVGRVGV